MKRILDRFDNSPLWIRLVTVLSLSFILVAGLYTVKKNTAAQVTTEIQPAKKTGSLPVKKETKEEKEKKEEKKNTEAAEKAVVQMETTPSQDSVNAAQAAVKKVKDATQKQSLDARMRVTQRQHSRLKQTLMPTRTQMLMLMPMLILMLE